MISIETVTSVLKRAQQMDLGDYMSTCDFYGRRREEIFGYLMSFNQVVSIEALDDLMRFFVFLVHCFEQQYGNKPIPN